MKKNTRETIWTIFYLIAGVVAAWLTWFFLPGRKFGASAPSLPAFIIVGAAGALIYSSIKLRSLGWAILMIVLMFFLQLALIPPLRAETVILSALWAAPVGMAFLVSAYLFKPLKRLPIGKFIMMAFLIGCGYALVALLFRLRAGLSVYIGLLRYQFIAGVMLGGFLGLLIELFELIPIAKKPQSAGFEPPA